MPAVRLLGRKEVRIGTCTRVNRSGGLGPARGLVAACTPAARIALPTLQVKKAARGNHAHNQVSRLLCPSWKTKRDSNKLSLTSDIRRLRRLSGFKNADGE